MADIKRTVQRRLAAAETDNSQIVGSEAVHRADKHRKKRDVVGRIVDNTKDIENELDLARIKEVLALLAIRGYSVFAELLDKLRASLLL